MHLRAARARGCAQGRAPQSGKGFQPSLVSVLRELRRAFRQIAVILRNDFAPHVLLHVAARDDPLAPQGGQPVAHVRRAGGVAPRPRSVIDAHRLVRLRTPVGQTRRLQTDFAQLHAQAIRDAFHVNPARVRQAHVRAPRLSLSVLPVHSVLPVLNAAHTRLAFRAPTLFSPPPRKRERPPPQRNGLSLEPPCGGTNRIRFKGSRPQATLSRAHTARGSPVTLSCQRSALSFHLFCLPLSAADFKSKLLQISHTNKSSTGIVQPGRAGSASATSPRLYAFGLSGSPAR